VIKDTCRWASIQWGAPSGTRTPNPLVKGELLNGALKHRPRETGSETTAAVAETSGQASETGPGDETVEPVDLVTVSSLGVAKRRSDS
jgi:hypothetical protein